MVRKTKNEKTEEQLRLEAKIKQDEIDVKIKQEKQKNSARFWLNIGYACIALISILFIGTILFTSEPIDRTISNITILQYEMSPAVCSQHCISINSSINIRPEMYNYLTTGRASMWYLPYFEDLRCYDYDSIQNKNCCIQYTLKQ